MIKEIEAILKDPILKKKLQQFQKVQGPKDFAEKVKLMQEVNNKMQKAHQSLLLQTEKVKKKHEQILKIQSKVEQNERELFAAVNLLKKHELFKEFEKVISGSGNNPCKEEVR